MAMADCLAAVGYGEADSAFGAGSRQKGCGKLVAADRYEFGWPPTMTRVVAARLGRSTQLAAGAHLVGRSPINRSPVSRSPARYAQALIAITQKAARS